MRSYLRDRKASLTSNGHFLKCPIASLTSLAIHNCSFDRIFFVQVEESAADDTGLLDPAVLLMRGGISDFFSEMMVNLLMRILLTYLLIFEVSIIPNS